MSCVCYSRKEGLSASHSAIIFQIVHWILRGCRICIVCTCIYYRQETNPVCEWIHFLLCIILVILFLCDATRNGISLLLFSCIESRLCATLLTTRVTLDIVCVTIVDSLEHILEPQYDVPKRYTLLLSIVPTCWPLGIILITTTALLSIRRIGAGDRVVVSVLHNTKLARAQSTAFHPFEVEVERVRDSSHLSHYLFNLCASCRPQNHASIAFDSQEEQQWSQQEKAA